MCYAAMSEWNHAENSNFKHFHFPCKMVKPFCCLCIKWADHDTQNFYFIFIWPTPDKPEYGRGRHIEVLFFFLKLITIQMHFVCAIVIEIPILRSLQTKMKRGAFSIIQITCTAKSCRIGMSYIDFAPRNRKFYATVILNSFILSNRISVCDKRITPLQVPMMNDDSAMHQIYIWNVFHSFCAKFTIVVECSLFCCFVSKPSAEVNVQRNCRRTWSIVCR